MDRNGWERRHRIAYGCGAWERAAHQARLLVAWYDERDGGLGPGVAPRFSAGPGARVKWPWGNARHNTLGLLFWRAAHDAGIPVDQVLLSDAVSYCAQGAEPLDAGPVPDAALKTGIGVGSAESVAAIRHVLQAHAEADLPRPRPAGVRLTLGYRVRELRATPDWDLGDWPAALAEARRAMGQADDLRERGTWRPTDRERSVGGRLGQDLERSLRTPAASGHPAPRWLERASRLAATGTALSAAAGALLGNAREDTRPDATRPDATRRNDAGSDSAGWDDAAPLVKVLGTATDACARLAASTEEIGRLWEAEEPPEPPDRSSWELAHIPGALLEQTGETEDLIRALAAFLWVLAVH
ncbi:hypothetical protein ACFXAW_00620 [Streptomyces sp. NPDC059445]|uniref:hypothetical protein n=1 Tax=Streptomyces sp. NPDC059445 TaxID=3346832 RepID=UPI0036840D35